MAAVDPFCIFCDVMQSIQQRYINHFKQVLDRRLSLPPSLSLEYLQTKRSKLINIMVEFSQVKKLIFVFL